MEFRCNFEYDTAYPYSNQLDLPTLSTAIDNDGADNFFGSINDGLEVSDIKQEVMSPFSQTLENESNENSEYMTPMANSNASQYEFGEDKENVSRTPINRQLILGNDSPNGISKVNTHAIPTSSNVDNLSVAMNCMQLSVKKMNTPARKSVKFQAETVEKIHPMETRLDTVVNTPTIVLRSRTVIRKSQACSSPALEKVNEQEDINVCEAAPATSHSSQPLPNIRLVPFARPEKEQKRKASPTVHNLHRTKRYISMAEELRKFQLSTPDRFHTKPRTTTMKPTRASMAVLKTTVPQSPAFLCKARARPVNHPTREEIEEEELREIKSHPVKALPLNQKVFQTPNLGKPVEKRQPTEIAPFHLTEVTKKERVGTPAFNFSARPIPKGILQKVTGLPEKLVPKLTDPVAPSFEKRRVAAVARRTAIVVNEKGDEKVMGSREIFHYGTPNIGHRRATEIAPFSFDERDKLAMEKKKEKLKMIFDEEKKQREFHANPLPRSIGGSVTSLNNNAVQPGQPIMSMFMTDGYKQRREERILAKEREEEELLKKLTVFKARPATVVHAKPFEPKKPELSLLEVEPFEFNTERRAKEWAELELAKKAKEDELDVYRKQRQEEVALQEAQEIARIRKDTVHIANPMPRIKPFSIRSSKKDLTVPITPFRQRDAAEDE